MKRNKRKMLLMLAVLLAVMTSAVPFCAAVHTQTMPVLMYHDLTEDPAAVNSLTVTGERFRMDMEFLQAYGYTPLLPSELAALRKNGGALPSRPVMITFDDGYRSNYEIAYPILQQTGMKAVIAVLGGNVDRATAAGEPRGFMTWDELREMAESGLVEVGSHTYGLHNGQYGGSLVPDGINGVMRRRGESQRAYRARVGGDLRRSIDGIVQHTGQKQVCYFAYPFGAYDSWMQQMLEENGVSVSVVTKAGAAAPLVSLHKMPRYAVRMDQPVSALLRRADSAVPTLAAISVNGAQSRLPAYHVDGHHFVRVRDVAMLLRQTASGFDVQWNAGQRRVELTSFAAYTPLGTELQPLPQGTRRLQSLPTPTMVDGAAHMVASYQAEGVTYYKLRSLGELCGFAVDWNSEAHLVEVTA